jgi:hypothetical protein
LTLATRWTTIQSKRLITRCSSRADHPSSCEQKEQTHAKQNAFVGRSDYCTGANVGAAGSPPTIEAATVTVISLGDTGAGTLRQAIVDANPGDTIDFSVTGTITLSSGRLIVLENLTITGPGASSLTIYGNNSSGVILTAIGTVAISRLTLTNGNVGVGQGGGAENQGTLTLTDVVVSNNVARLGGGIFNSGTLTLTRTTVKGNTDTQ